MTRERAWSAGLDFIWISNHGGRQLDSGRGGAVGADAITNLFRAELMVDMALAGLTSVRGISRDAVDYINY
jgi:isopentenyl diphosphate isomerase/L-lactate dehydrogenase-like FMN-dependent dehydrogenase